MCRKKVRSTSCDSIISSLCMHEDEDEFPCIERDENSSLSAQPLDLNPTQLTVHTYWDAIELVGPHTLHVLVFFNLIVSLALPLS